MTDKRILSQEEKRKQVHHVGIRPADILLVPNLLSLSRLLFAIPAVWLIVSAKGTYYDHWAAVLLCLGFLSDVLDGFWARTFHAISDLGKILDPVIDKLVVISTAVALGFSARDPQLPHWLIYGIIFRDVFILILARRALSEDHYLFVSSWTGKATTFAIALTLLAWLIEDLLPEQVIFLLPWIVLGLLVLSSVDYLEKYWSVRHKRVAKRTAKDRV